MIGDGWRHAAGRLAVIGALLGASGALAPAEAQRRLGLVRGTETGLVYGTSGWQRVTNAINTAFGGAANVSVLDGLTAAGLGGVDALWIDLRAGSSSLSAAERTELRNFAATGRRVVIIGENQGWTTWNNSFLNELGGSFDQRATGTPAVALTHPITSGITNLPLASAGTAIGGTSLFASNVATLWGPTANVLTFLDASTLGDGNWNNLILGGPSNQAIFAGNVTTWVAAPVAVIPEPGTWMLLGTGLLALGGVAARRRR